MSPRSKIAVRYALYAALLGAVLSVITLVVIVLQSGYNQPSLFATILVYLSYWPMLLVGWSAHNLFVSFVVLPLNLIGWILVGFVLGWLRGNAK